VLPDEDDDEVPASPLEPLDELVEPLLDDELDDDELVPESAVAAGGFEGGGSFALSPVSVGAGAVWFCVAVRSSSLGVAEVAQATRPPRRTTAEKVRTTWRMGRTLRSEFSTVSYELDRETQG